MGLTWTHDQPKGNPMTTFQSRNWGEGNFRQGNGALEGVVNQLPPNVKQAMYAAANRGLIKRGTWNGCAFNAGSLEVAKTQDECLAVSTTSAAKFFGITPELVNTFITRWDALQGTDEECTDRLKKAILDVGLFTEPGESKGRRVLRTTVWKSEETRMREKFEAMVEGLDLEASAEESPMAFATAEMGTLLSV